ncbi:MAG: hypothetical protein HYZ49_10300 [Chloroflexi bacterium]|nr:hypothetical protein [Chloroflexota bacterium]
MQTFAQFRYTEISRAFKQAPWRVQTQMIATLAVVAVVVVALGGMYLAEASRAATAGRDVQSLQEQKAALNFAIDRQEATLAEAKALTRLEARARELGYVPALSEQMEFLVVNGYPGAQTVAATPAAEVALPDYNESLGTAVAHWLSTVIRPGG